ncbi:MAG: hypothetical protein ACOYOO_15215 [Saprospiraceae bacterium]
MQRFLRFAPTGAFWYNSSSRLFNALPLPFLLLLLLLLLKSRQGPVCLPQPEFRKLQCRFREQKTGITTDGASMP